jgi:hypothetical protein
LTIRGQSKTDDERKDRSYVIREHRTGSFVRSVRLPRWVDVDGAQAKLKHGLLQITFPKAPAAATQHVPVAMGGQPAIETAPSQTIEGTAQAVDNAPSGDQPADPKRTRSKAAGAKANSRPRSPRGSDPKAPAGARA